MLGFLVLFGESRIIVWKNPSKVWRKPDYCLDKDGLFENVTC